MSKRRVTLNLDEDVVRVLQAAGGRSLSDTVNRVLRAGTEAMAHRDALATWLDELDATHGTPTDAELGAADDLLDDVFGPDDASSAA